MERASEQEGRERGGGADMAATQKRRKRGRRDGRGERRVSALPKKWKGRVYQLISEREECEGVTNMEQEATGLVVGVGGRSSLAFLADIAQIRKICFAPQAHIFAPRCRGFSLQTHVFASKRP